MRAVVHDTPGLIDIRAFTTFGISSKPNSSSPIGYFGTGLKYATAILARERCPVTVWIGEEPHVFFTRETQFRDGTFTSLRMRRRAGLTARWRATDLPYTTELGKNWKTWQALRELHSNTLDEGGSTYVIDDDGRPTSATGEVSVDVSLDVQNMGAAGRTRIVVEGSAYAAEFAKLSSIFLPGAAAGGALGTGGALGVQMLPGQSTSVYYRGLRAMELQKLSVRTWNVLAQTELTEDRTIKFPFYVEYYVTRYLMASEDEDLLREVLQAPDTTFEGSLDWAQNHYASSQFVAAAGRWGRRSARSYYVAHSPEARKSLDWREQLRIVLEAGVEPEEVGKMALQFSTQLRALLRSDLERSRGARAEETEEMPF